MSRLFLAGLIAIAFLFLGSIAILYRFGGGAPRFASSRPPGAPGESSSSAPGSPVPATTSPPSAASATAPATPVAALLRSPEPLHRAPQVQDVMPAPRRRALVSFRQQMIAGLADLEQRVARCAQGGGRGLAAASFVLGLETVAGGIRIRDVQLETGGSASEAEVACARAALRGHVIPAASAEPGRQWQLRFSARSST